MAVSAATFTVTTTADSGAGSLRQAILDANMLAGLDTIEFSIAAAGVQTIVPLTALPTITSPVIVDGYSQPGASPNTLAAGTDAVLLIELNGTSAGGFGLFLNGAASGSTIRGLVINRFSGGIALDGADDTTIEGNYIGTDPTGLIDRGNTGSGVFILNSSEDNIVGGLTPAARNVISGNSTNVSIGNNDCVGTLVQGNYVGLNANGTAGVPGGIGVSINGAGPTTIGGTGSARNYIGGNTVGSGGGIVISNNAIGIVVVGNVIGLAVDGVTTVPNSLGILLNDGFSGAPSNTIIGGVGGANVIAGNLGDGVVLASSNLSLATGVTISLNSIYGNGGLGIDLGDDGVTPNDALDGDGGLNDRQNFPVLSSASALGGNLTIQGSMHGVPESIPLIELFHSTTCDPSGHGEGETLVAIELIELDSLGNGAFNVTVASGVTNGFITATATDNGSTSEFSPCQAVTVAAEPLVTINDITVPEGNVGTSLATFTVWLSAAPPAGATVSYTTADGTATVADNDYDFTSGTLVFAAGETSKTIDVTIQGDFDPEPDETFFVNLTGATNASIADPQGVGTITTTDGVPLINIADVAALEGDAGTTTLTFTVELSATPDYEVEVSYATADGTAAEPGDYAGTTGTVTIPAGSTSGTFDVVVNGDDMYELDETLTVTLFGPSNAILADPQAIGTITNDDPIPTVTIDDPSVVEGNSGETPLNFTLTLSNPSYLTVSVPFVTANDTATAPSDYVAASGSVTFVSPQTVRTTRVRVWGDTDIEDDETLLLNLTGATNATLADTQGVGTIVNDDTLTPAVVISDASVTEGDAGTTLATFTLTLSLPPTSEVSVSYVTADGSATAGSDYLADSGTVTFPIGQQMATIDIVVNGDQLQEPDETFFVNLNTPSGVVIGDTQGVGTINNDDPAPDLTLVKSGPATVVLNQNFAYTIVVTNNSEGDATDVVVTDVLPDEVTFVSAVVTQGNCSGTETVTCLLGTILAGDSATITINVTAPSSPASFENTASVLATQVDTDASDNAGTAGVTAFAPAVSNIPSLTEWGLLTLLLALAGLAMRRI